MKNAIQPSSATFAFILTLLFALFFAPALRAQVLYEEDWETADLGFPVGWTAGSVDDGNVDPGQACAGNGLRMNLFNGNTNSTLSSPSIDRGGEPGKLIISFDYRVADWNDNSQLNGTGLVGLNINGTTVWGENISLTTGCERQTRSRTVTEVPLNSNFQLSFVGQWTSGDWAYVVDNITVQVIPDECADAVLLPQTAAPVGILDGNVVDGSFGGATQSQPGCTGNANDDVWYQFVATQRSVSVTVQAGDVVAELFSGSCGSLTSLRCSDVATTNEFFDYYGTNVGETYYVRVHSFAGTDLTGTDADFRIQIGTPRSVNNECVAATELTQSAATSCGTNLTMGTVESATESQAACTGTANDDVWYEFEATSTGFTVYLESGDFVVQLFEGSCGGLVSLDCEDGIDVNETFSYAGATVGANYYLRVYSFGGAPLTGTDAEFGICVFTTPTAPANDDCADATELFISPTPGCITAEAGTTNGASRTEADPLCDGSIGRSSVWYRFTAAETEHFVTLSSVELLNGTENARSSFEVFSGGCGARTRVQCSGQLFGTDPGPQTVSGLTVGQEYLIRVVPVNLFDQIDFNICITRACPAPPSDLSVSNITSSTAVLSHTYPFGVSKDHVVTLPGGDPVNAAVFSETSLQNVATATGLQPATDYEYHVINACEGASAGPIAFTTKILGDECAAAFSLTQSAATSCGTNLTMGSVEGATESLSGCTGTANDDVWYEFEATSTDFTVYLESGDFVVQLFEGSCGNLVSLDCEDGIPVNETFNYASATVGNTYFLRVYSFGGTALTGTDAEFGICVFTTPTAPANDDCADATDLFISPTPSCVTAEAGTTNGASRPEADPRCAGINGITSVWYRFTAAETEHFVTLSSVELLNGTENTRSSFEVFSGACGALTRVQCSGQLFGTDPGPQTVSGLTVGQEYLIRVVPVNPADQIDFDICVTTDCPDLATGLSVTDITATTASLNIDAVAGVERDFIIVAAGDVPVFGDGSNYVYFTSSEGNIPVEATGLSSNTAYDFYVGQACPETFAGPVTFTTRPSCGDVIYDTGGPSGNYGNDEDYTVTICPETADPTGGARRVSITFDEFDSESGFDGITLYDGEDTAAPVITCPGTGLDYWSWERVRNLGSGDLQRITVFTTNVSGCITLRFTSDGSMTFPGFKATINCDETSTIFDQILIPVPAGSGAVVADRGYLSLASGYMYYVKEGVGSLLALKLGDTQGQIPFSGVSVVAGSGTTNLGLNGCMAPYTNVPDWWTMNRTWDVAPLFAPAFPVEVRFLYTSEDFMAIESASGFAGLTHENLTHYKINGGDEEDLTAAGNACHDLVSPENYQEFDPGQYVYLDLTDGSAERNGHAAQFSVTSFSGGGGGAKTAFGGALPAEFLSFQGEAGPKFNHLNWTTAREENTATHELERSSDGTNWELVLTLPAAGNSDDQIRYDAIDEQAPSFAYYRVRTLDQDGSFTHSAIIDIQRTDTDGTRVGTAFPNPATDRVVLPYFAEVAGEKLQLDLLDASGRRLSGETISTHTGRNELRVSLQKLPAGLYWLALTTPEGARHLRRLVKQ